MCRTRIVSDNKGLSGLSYFQKLMPESCHAMASYSGIGFATTLRMLYFDLEAGKIIVNPDLSDVKRLIASDESGLVTGAAISHYIPKFAEVLDYEKYLVVSADKKEYFFQLFNELCKYDSKYELITFRSREQKFLENESIMEQCQDIHHWQLYSIKPDDCHIPIKKAIDLPTLPESDASIETMPHRYCAFASSGLSDYSTWVLEDKNKQPLSICSLLPYSPNQKELKLWYCKNAAHHIQQITLFMQKAVYLSLNDNESVVWRIKNPSAVEESILKTGKFKCIGKEMHYHFDFQKR